jgi:hypothetical protein
LATGRYPTLAVAITEMARSIQPDPDNLRVGSWVHSQNVIPLSSELSRLIGYSFDKADVIAVEHGLGRTSAEDDRWFDYPLVGVVRLDLSLARHADADPVMVRLRSNDRLRAELTIRIDAAISLFNSYRVGPGSA